MSCLSSKTVIATEGVLSLFSLIRFLISVSMFDLLCGEIIPSSLEAQTAIDVGISEKLAASQEKANDIHR